jgi:hypothetical protein
LLLREALADDDVDHRLRERGRDPLTAHAALLLGALHTVEVSLPMGLQNPVADIGEEPGRQHPVGWSWPEVRTWPQEIVGFRDDDLRGSVVQPKMGFQGGRD